MQQRYLFIAVFFSGLSTLAVEMTASRLLGNFFGTSNLVWASIIGLILIYLTVGYFLGGYWADRSPHYRTFFQILAWGAFTAGLIPIAARPVLRLAANAFDELQLGILFGSFTAVMILFIIPVTLLGTASPFAIRLAIQDARQAGRISGFIYGISTLGSFIGTFLPSLILIPSIGTYRSFLVIGGLLLIVALFGLWKTSGWRITAAYLWMPLVIGVLAVAGLPGTDKNSPGLIYEGESAYNYIQVLGYDDYRVLRLNEGQGMHSIYHPTQLNFNGPWEQVLAGPFFNPAPYHPDQVESLAIVGLAAGTTARQATAVYGEDIVIDGIEIDPEIVDVARKHFGMDLPNLNVIIQDGRWGLVHSNRKYDIISVDAYRPPYIPWHMTTQEFFQETYARLNDNGVLVINIGRGPDDRRLIDSMTSTIASIYPSVYAMDIPGSFNSIVYATVQPTQVTNLQANLDYLVALEEAHPLLLASVATTQANLRPVVTSERVFTDDLAPIEWITNTMIFEFFLSGDVEQLQ